MKDRILYRYLQETCGLSLTFDEFLEDYSEYSDNVHLYNNDVYGIFDASAIYNIEDAERSMCYDYIDHFVEPPFRYYIDYEKFWNDCKMDNETLYNIECGYKIGDCTIVEYDTINDVPLL